MQDIDHAHRHPFCCRQFKTRKRKSDMWNFSNANSSIGFLRILLRALLVFPILLATVAVHAQTFVQTHILSNGTANQFGGWAVAVSGDWMLVGNPSLSGPPGFVGVYQRSGTHWYLFTELTASDATAGDQFGAAIAMDQDTIVIGAPHANVSGVVAAGRAYVFRHGHVYSTPTTPASDYFVEVTPLSAPAIGTNFNFGFSVAVKGDSVAVGAPYSNNYLNGALYNAAGLAALYRRDAGGSNLWGNTALVMGENHAGDNFGYAVALGASNLAVGAPNARLGSVFTGYINSAGRTYFFNVGNDGSAIYQQYVASSTSASNRGFGAAVAIDGDLVAVGAPGAAGVYVPSVEVWQRDGGGIFQPLKRIDSPFDASAFGAAVSLHGTGLLIGAPNLNSPGFTYTGIAYLYAQNNGGSNNWGVSQTLVPDSGGVYSYNFLEMGRSVSLDTVTAVAGAPIAAAGAGSVTSAGAAFVFSSDAMFKNGFECPQNMVCLGSVSP